MTAKNDFCFFHSKTAATRPLPIERASKTDLLSILALYQQYYLIPIQAGRAWGVVGWLMYEADSSVRRIMGRADGVLKKIKKRHIVSNIEIAM